MPSVGTKRLKWSADCRIFVGHTTMDDITFLWDGRVVAVNVDYCGNFKAGVAWRSCWKESTSALSGEE